AVTPGAKGYQHVAERKPLGVCVHWFWPAVDADSHEAVRRDRVGELYGTAVTRDVPRPPARRRRQLACSNHRALTEPECPPSGAQKRRANEALFRAFGQPK